MSGINSYEANINDEWVLFEYDNKNKMIISKKRTQINHLKVNLC